MTRLYIEERELNTLGHGRVAVKAHVTVADNFEAVLAWAHDHSLAPIYSFTRYIYFTSVEDAQLCYLAHAG
ncbi:MAG: hypothetical protein EOO77_32350 [Oxalobacteraceae bacterium]|nr:MAG: hypothetical protein EOO77_32350 [Oxalobacteraceae bacterium]